MNSPQNNNNTLNKEKLARKRWELLKRAIHKKTLELQNDPVSKRRFENYKDLVSINRDGKNRLKIDVEVIVGENTYQLKLHRETDYSYNIEVSDLSHFDISGRISIWPSSQVLTYWCLKNLNYFDDKSIIELGCGFHALPGLSICKFCKAQEVVLSDGDSSNINEVTKSLLLNVRETKKTSVRVLRWDEYDSCSQLEGRFDIVIAADIVYHDSSLHQRLIDTILKLLKSGGKFFLFNPPRNKKLAEFLSLAQASQHFSTIDLCQDYDDYITHLSNKLKATHPYYDPDIHYPLLAILQKL